MKHSSFRNLDTVSCSVQAERRIFKLAEEAVAAELIRFALP